MKKVYLLSVATALVAFTMTSCGGGAEEAAGPVTYSLDADASKLEWKGDAADGSHSHNGTVKISEGTVVYNGEAFESGKFKVDLKTIDSELDASTGEDKLVGHLSAPDYFNSVQFPSADIEITSMTDKEVTATVSLAGKKMPVTFPAKISQKDDKLTIKGKFDLDFTPLAATGFTPDPVKEAEHKGSYVSPMVHFDLDAVLKAPEAKK